MHAPAQVGSNSALENQILNYVKELGAQLPETEENRSRKERIRFIVEIVFEKDEKTILNIYFGDWGPRRVHRIAKVKPEELGASDDTKAAYQIAAEIVEDIAYRQWVVVEGTLDGMVPVLNEKLQRKDEATKKFLQDWEVVDFYSYRNGKCGAIISRKKTPLTLEPLLQFVMTPEQIIAFKNKNYNQSLITKFSLALRLTLNLQSNPPQVVAINIPQSFKNIMREIYTRLNTPDTGMMEALSASLQNIPYLTANFSQPIDTTIVRKVIYDACINFIQNYSTVFPHALVENALVRVVKELGDQLNGEAQGPLKADIQNIQQINFIDLEKGIYTINLNNSEEMLIRRFSPETCALLKVADPANQALSKAAEEIIRTLRLNQVVGVSEEVLNKMRSPDPEMQAFNHMIKVRDFFLLNDKNGYVILFENLTPEIEEKFELLLIPADALPKHKCGKLFEELIQQFTVKHIDSSTMEIILSEAAKETLAQVRTLYRDPSSPMGQIISNYMQSFSPNSPSNIAYFKAFKDLIGV